MKSVDFPETVSAKVTSRCKHLLKKYDIPVRSAIEVGLNQLLSVEERLEFELAEVSNEISIQTSRLEDLEREKEEIISKLESLRSSEDSVRATRVDTYTHVNTCKSL